MNFNFSKSSHACKDYVCDSKNSSESFYPSNYPRNYVDPGYFADNECSDTNVSRSTSTFQTNDCQNPKTTEICHNLSLQTQTGNSSTHPGTRGRTKIEACECNPYHRMRELLELSVENEMNAEWTDASTCSLKSKCAKWVELTFAKKYGCISEDLVFARDVLTITLNSNGISFKFNYLTANAAPRSPCTEILEKAFISMLRDNGKKFGEEFDRRMDGKDVNFKNFQDLLLKAAMEWEQVPYQDLNILMHLVIICQWTVCALKKGVEPAVYFAPLVICRIIYRLRIWGKINQTFWKDLEAEAAKFVAAKSNS